MSRTVGNSGRYDQVPLMALAIGAPGDPATPIGTDNPLPIGGAILPAGTDRSGTIAAGGIAQQLAPANAARTGLTGQNISAGDLWLNEAGGAAAIGAPGSYRVATGAAFAIATSRAISVIGAATGQAWTATET